MVAIAPHSQGHHQGSGSTDEKINTVQHVEGPGIVTPPQGHEEDMGITELGEEDGKLNLETILAIIVRSAFFPLCPVRLAPSNHLAD
jgi:hypothetical protein